MSVCSSDTQIVTCSLKTEKIVDRKMICGSQFTDMKQIQTGEFENVTPTNDGQIIFWDRDIAKPIHILKDASKNCLYSISISQDQQYFAVGGNSGIVQIFGRFEKPQS